MNKPIKVNDGNFEEEVLQENKPVLVLFYADWAQLSRITQSYVIKIAKKYGDHIKVCTLDVDKNQSTSSHYEITSIPSTLLFEGGEIKKKVDEYIPEPELINLLELDKLKTTAH